MGERLRRLTVEAFRGVPDTWEVEWPHAASMVVLGDNGTGKSTIADALEWYFKGRIGFLAREGRERSVRHVGAAKTAATSVSVETTGSLGGRQPAPGKGSSPWLASRVADNFVLRGRTLSDFVEQPKAEKWRTLAGILGLDTVDGLRLDLQKIRNQLEDEASEQEKSVRLLGAALRPKPKTSDENGVLAAIRDAALTADLNPPDSLDQALDPGWLPSALTTPVPAKAVEVSSLKADLRAALTGPPSLDGIEAWNAFVVAADVGVHDRLQLAQAADGLLRSQPDDGRCPLCQQPADWRGLRARVSSILDELQSASEERERAERVLQGTISSIRDYGRRLEGFWKRAAAVQVSIGEAPTSPGERMSACLKSGTQVDLGTAHEYRERCEKWLSNLDEAVREVPVPAGRDSGLVELATLCEQARKWHEARRRSSRAAASFRLADRLHAAFAKGEKSRYELILSSISNRVERLYTSLHPGEGFSGVAVEPWTDKGLELALDFHGTHQRPPQGVLSESHLNSLAVALFLAMAEMFNERLDFVVLDDVVNSFDVEHRGRLAELLVSEFRDRQLIVLTHDHQFYLHLARRAPSWTVVELTSWTFYEGPRSTRYATARLLDAARRALDEGDVQGGGGKTRRALEEILDEACESLEAALPYRRGHANDRRELAELMGGLRSRLRSSARDWYTRLAPLLTDLEADVQAALNVEAHAGRGWASMQEIDAALGRVATLDDEFSCHACRSRIWARGDYRAAHCICGQSVYPPRREPRLEA